MALPKILMICSVNYLQNRWRKNKRLLHTEQCLAPKAQFLMSAPKEVSGKWSIAHTLWDPRPTNVNLMGGGLLCEQATFFYSFLMPNYSKKNFWVFKKRVPSCVNKYFQKAWDILRSLELQEGKLNSWESPTLKPLADAGSLCDKRSHDSYCALAHNWGIKQNQCHKYFIH
jgi:hypothetical protein